MKDPLLPLPPGLGREADQGRGEGAGKRSPRPMKPCSASGSCHPRRNQNLLTPTLSLRRRGQAAALLLLSLLPACTLIDQNTFRPGAGAPPVIPAAPPAPVAAAAFPGPAPLLILQPSQFTTGDAAIRAAVTAARARKPDVEFDVAATLPGTPSEDATRRALLDAASVARVIVAQGVPQPRVRVLARPELAATVGDIRIYVR